MIGIKAEKDLLPLQSGNGPTTYANVDNLIRQFGYKPLMSVKEGIKTLRFAIEVTRNKMCGIVGIYHYHSNASTVDRDELRNIRDYMYSRGPDGKGEWFSNNRRAGLGHRRLSIIDLSEQGKQPMQSKAGLLSISFNGEIYNYKELRTTLENKGYKFNSQSDTEVLLHLYHEKGVSMLSELRGMFAFSLWDETQNTMLLARDPYGIKPLYYANDGKTIRVASQVKALLTGGMISKTKSPAGVAGFFLFGHMPEPYTQYQDVFSLPAGSYAVIDQSGMHEPIQYFDLSQAFNCVADVSKKEAQQIVYEAMSESLKYHLVSDVPVGIFLSAGIDSGAILSLAGEDRCRKLQTLTLAFEEFMGSENDESHLSAQVSSHYHAGEHHKRVLGSKEFSNDMNNFLNAMDQPTIDGLNTFFVSKAASELGWKVALSGVGGDEMFCGYPSFKDIPQWVSRMNMPSQIPFFGSAFYNVVSHVSSHIQSINPKMAGIVKYGGSYAGAYLLRRGIFLPEELPEIMGSEMAEEGLKQLSVIDHIEHHIGSDERPENIKVSLLESSLYMRNQLLRDADWAGMTHSLEIRTPFVDAHLIRKIAPVLATHWNTPGKGLVASSLKRALPRKITSREKTGFSTPISKWLQTDKQLDTWKNIPLLQHDHTPWARRWAYIIANIEGMV